MVRRRKRDETDVENTSSDHWLEALMQGGSSSEDEDFIPPEVEEDQGTASAVKATFEEDQIWKRTRSAFSLQHVPLEQLESSLIEAPLDFSTAVEAEEEYQQFLLSLQSGALLPDY